MRECGECGLLCISAAAARRAARRGAPCGSPQRGSRAPAPGSRDARRSAPPRLRCLVHLALRATCFFSALVVRRDFGENRGTARRASRRAVVGLTLLNLRSLSPRALPTRPHPCFTHVPLFLM